MKKIKFLIEGLKILEKYSNEVYASDHQIIAGPPLQSLVYEEDQKALENLDWFFEENMGWTFWVG